MKRRRLGQHYLVDPEVVRRIVGFAQIAPMERVLEIGTGRGALTREAAGLGSSFVGYELDPRNHEETSKAVRGTRARIYLADAFKQSPAFDVLVSSLPYSESVRFIEWLAGIEFKRAIVVLQVDFVRKVLAPPGDREYRGVSALSQIAFDVRVLEHLERKAFSPQPRVDSVVVSIVPRRVLPRAEISNVMRLFSLRRRQTRSALGNLGIESKKDYGLRRVYELGPDEVHELCDPSAPP
ncbi:MAG TPA: rRNA adenine N-6-methyltransferase family protein [Nitrososphaerales archaeon]|nr:rRNA adenine N-6-methyltransferase family protein [Nitrososphaerales archaeon]